MAGSEAAAEASEALSDSELRAFRRQLSALAQTARKYPFECSLGSYDLLFESRDDIEGMMANLGQSIETPRSFGSDRRS